MSTTTTTPRADAAQAARSRSHRYRPFRLALLLLVIALVALFQPDCFRFAVRHFIRFEAWRNGVDAQLGTIGGSLFEPVVLHDSVWSYESENGPVTRLEIKTATAGFSWRNLLPRSSGQWFQRLTLEGVSGKVSLPPAVEGAAKPGGFALRVPRPRGRWLASPERFEAADVDFIFASNGDYVRLTETAFTLSNVATGAITAGQILVKQPWLTHTFRNVTGTTAIQDGTLQIAGLTLEPGVQIEDFSTSLDDLARGQLKLALQLAAFGGKIRAEVETLPDELQFSIGVAVQPISPIDVAKLANFLGASDAAGGTIKAGQFRFRGPPQQLAKASGEVRAEVANFQWETRQWDALVLGVKLRDGHIEIPEFALTQGRNRVAFSGEMAWPVPGVAWWQSEFSLTIKEGQLDDLTALSALLMPEFRFAAGRATVRGSVRGKDQKFDGQLVISGAQLRWRNAPIDKLDASVILNGNEYQISNVSVRNGADYLSGSGVVNIVGDKQYWGELHASVQDLAKYAAILQQPIIPEPLAGGAIIEWDGEGSAKGHSGKFLARLHKVRSLGATAALLHPIDADFEGSYSHGGMVFSKFAVSDDDTSFTAHVGVVDKAISLQGMRLMHGQSLWLEGDALLPLDVWNAWPNTSLATLLDDHTVGKLNVTASDLSLHETAQLTGLRFPIEGLVRGNVTAEGPLGALKTSGALTLTKARLPLGWSSDALTGVESAATFDGQTMRVEKFTGQHPTGDFNASGEIDFTNLRDPSLKIAVTSKKTAFRLFESDGENASVKQTICANVDATLDLKISGAASSSLITGTAQILRDDFPTLFRLSENRWLLEFLLGTRQFAFPSLFTLNTAPWDAWRFDIYCSTTQDPQAHVSQFIDVAVKGRGAEPVLVGTSEIKTASFQLDMLFIVDGMFVTSAKLEFREAFPRDPSIDLRLRGSVFDQPYTVNVIGTLDHPIRFFSYEPPLTERAIRAAFYAQATRKSLEETLSDETAAKSFGGERRFSLLVPVELREGVEMFDWPEIKAEPSAAGGAAVENAPAPASGVPQ